ncbi:MAG: hypothetical protein U5Q44_13185 [Dehalococcoidia bacterium]|nr:hypothetical protein [Dehalococcoidia bacterium]
MSDLKLDPVTRTASTAPRLPGEDRYSGGQQQRRHRKREHIAPTLLARLLPDRDPETLLVESVAGEDGQPGGVAIKDRASGRVLLRISAQALQRFQGDDNPGTLVEERG